MQELTLTQMLDSHNLTGLVQGIRSGLPPVIPDTFLTPTRQVKGDRVDWFEATGVRDPARLAHYGGPAHVRQLEGLRRHSAAMIHAFEQQTLPIAAWSGLLDPQTGQSQTLARQEVECQTRSFKQRFVNLRQAAVACALIRGRLDFSRDGQLLPDQSASAWNIDFHIPETNIGPIVGAEGVLADETDSPWSAASTNIVAQIRALKSLALRTTGYPIGYAFYGSNIPSYLAANQSVSDWMQAMTPGSAAEDANTHSEIPGRMLGLQWVPVADACFATPDGQMHTLEEPDTVVFTPAPSAEWYELVQGSYAVPTGTPSIDTVDAMQEVFGMFSYARIEHNPPAVVQFAGDTFLPLIKVPASVFRLLVNW